eukprot:6177398-Pleurochrysis_carterae.AAC.2
MHLVGVEEVIEANFVLISEGAYLCCESCAQPGAGRSGERGILHSARAGEAKSTHAVISVS